jgi:hypothetical protein
MSDASQTWEEQGGRAEPDEDVSARKPALEKATRRVPPPQTVSDDQPQERKPPRPREGSRDAILSACS